MSTMLAFPARASLVVEGRFNGSGMIISGGRIEGTFVQWIDPRGTRTETTLRQWDINHETTIDSKHTVITRRDRGLTWVLDGSDSSYTEQTLADARDIAEMLEIADTTCRAWQPIPEHPDTVAGFEALHFRYRDRTAGAKLNVAIPTVTDLWVARGVPAAPMLATTSTWLINAPGMYASGARARGLGLPADAITLRITRSIDLLDTPEGAQLLSSADRDSTAQSTSSIGAIDFELGTLSLGGTEVTSIREAELPHGALDLPRGFARKADQDAELLKYWRSTRTQSRRPTASR